MNDYTRPLEYSDLNARSLWEWNLSFSDRICGPLDYGRPIHVTRELIAAPEFPVEEGKPAQEAGAEPER